MIDHPAFTVEPWALRESELHLDLIAQAGSVFALANGHIGLRGNLDEGEPNGLPGSYLNGFYEARPLPYAEAGYGYPEAGETVVNVTNGKIIRLLVDDEPFDVRFGECRSHERTLDFRAGVLRRRVEWHSPAGRTVRVSSVRLVSFVQRAVAAMLYEVEPLDSATRLVVQSELVANEPMPDPAHDPRAGARSVSPLRSEQFSGRDTKVVLVHSTEVSGLRLAAGMDHIVDGPPGTETNPAEFGEDLGRVTVTADVEPGQRLRLVKFLAYGWSSQRSTAALRDQVAAALAEARHTGWEGLLAGQRELPRRLLGPRGRRAGRRRRAAAGAPLRALPRAAGRRTRRAACDRREGADRPRLQRPRLLGHRDVRPAAPHLHDPRRGARRAALAACDARPGARAREAARARRGRPFPGGRSPARSARATGRPEPPPSTSTRTSPTRSAATTQRPATSAFERDGGLELLVETARLWRSLGHHDAAGRFRIDGVTGPDEYSAVADNNVYTNLMAQRNLLRGGRRRRAASATAPPSSASTSRRRPPGATPPAAIVRPLRRSSSGFIPRPRRFTEHQPWDFASTAAEQYPLLLHFPYFDLYRKQVVKQADLVLALHLRGDAFSDEAEGTRLRLLRGADRPRFLALGVHAGGDRGRGRPPGAGVRLLRRGRPDRPRRPASTTPATASTSPRWPAPGSWQWPASAACATTTARSPSPRGCPSGSAA